MKTKILIVTVVSMLISACSSLQYSSTESFDDVYYTTDQSVKVNKNPEISNLALKAKSGGLTDSDMELLVEESLKILDNDTLASVDSLIYNNEVQNPYEKILVNNVTEAMEKRRQASMNPYKGINNYYFLLTDDDMWYASAYDPAFYNIVVVGTEVWVEPNWVSAALGSSWGVNYAYNSFYRPTWGFGMYYNYSPYYNTWPYWGYGYSAYHYYHSPYFYGSYYAPYDHYAWARNRTGNVYHGRSQSDNFSRNSNYAYNRLSSGSRSGSAKSNLSSGRSVYNPGDRRVANESGRSDVRTSRMNQNRTTSSRKELERGAASGNRQTTRLTRSGNEVRSITRSVRSNSSQSRFNNTTGQSVGSTRTSGRSAGNSTVVNGSNSRQNLNSTNYTAPRRSTTYSQPSMNRTNSSINRSNNTYRRSNSGTTNPSRSSSGSSYRTNTSRSSGSIGSVSRSSGSSSKSSGSSSGACNNSSSTSKR